MANLREAGKCNWLAADPATIDQIKSGALQRIADACELMAKNHQHLLDQKQWAEEDRDAWCRRAKKLERRLAAYKGVVTKMKAEKHA